MNEELQNKFDSLKERIDNLAKEQAKLAEEIESLEDRRLSTLSKEELERYQDLTERKTMISNAFDKSDSKAALLNDYILASEKIDSLKNGGLNGAKKVSAVTKLTKVLSDILKSDNTVVFTSYDITRLQTEINNKDEFEKTIDMFDRISKEKISNIIDEINSILDSTNITKKETKNLLQRKSELEEKTKRNIKKVLSVALLGATIIVTAGVTKSCEKSKNRDNTGMIINIPSYEETLEPLPTPQPIATPEVTFNPTIDKEADMKNRASEIANTGFFSDLYNSDIVKLLEVIDSKQLDSLEYANFKQISITTFNQIMINYFTDSLTENDINKLNALRYYAKDNSDLDRFLETYTTLLQDILRNPYNQVFKDKMIDYIRVFADSINGFTENSTVLTSDGTFNENAIVNDYLDWAMVYDGIINPTTPFMVSRTVENIDGSILENIMFLNDEDREAYINNNGLSEYRNGIMSYIKLQETILEAESKLVNHPQYCYIVGYDRTLGGEK